MGPSETLWNGSLDQSWMFESHLIDVGGYVGIAASQVRIAKLEMQWESERKSVALQKLKAWFLDNVEVERIILRPFLGRFKVSSFRTAKLPPTLQREIAEVHQAVAHEEQLMMEAQADREVGGEGVAGGAAAFAGVNGKSDYADPDAAKKAEEQALQEEGMSKVRSPS